MRVVKWAVFSPVLVCRSACIGVVLTASSGSDADHDSAGLIEENNFDVAVVTFNFLFFFFSSKHNVREREQNVGSSTPYFYKKTQ